MDVWIGPFLTALRKTGIVSQACAQVSITSSTAYALRKVDADFAEAWRLAKLDHAEVCQAELIRRGMGYEEPVVYQGQLTPVRARDAKGQILTEAVPRFNAISGITEQIQVPVQERNADGSLKWLTVTKYDSGLLLAHVKAMMPEYATTRTEVTGANGGPLQTVDATQRRARIASIFEAAKQRVGLA